MKRRDFLKAGVGAGVGFLGGHPIGTIKDKEKKRLDIILIPGKI